MTTEKTFITSAALRVWQNLEVKKVWKEKVGLAYATYYRKQKPVEVRLT